jgi:hypothetical protein
MRRFPRVVVLAAAAILAGCAARRPAAPAVDVPALRRETDALVRAGCYQCLREADSRLAAAPAVALRSRRFQVLALLAARVRELGLTNEPAWIDQARALVDPAAPLEQLYVDLVWLTPQPRVLQWDIVAAPDQRLLHLATQVAEDLAPRAATDPVAAYFLIAAACGPLPVPGDAASAASPQLQTPLVLIAGRTADASTGRRSKRFAPPTLVLPNSGISSPPARLATASC